MLRQLSRRIANICSLQKVQYERKAPKLLASKSGEINFVRFKYVTSGVQGRRNSKTKSTANKFKDEDDDEEDSDTISLNDT